jgi:hypothetical protein
VEPLSASELADTANEFLDEVEAASRAVRARKSNKKKPAKKSAKKKRK